MSILLINSRFPPGDGEIRRYLMRFSKAISNEIKTTVLTTKSKGWKNYDPNLDIHLIRAGREKGNLLKIISLNRKAAKLVGRGEYKHIIASTWNAAGTTAMNIYMRTKIPYSIVLFGQDIRRYIARQPIAERIKIILENARFIYATSQYTAELIESLRIDENKIKVIRAGGDPIELKNGMSSEELTALRNSHGLDNHKKLILSIGRLEKMKAFDILIWSIFLLSKRSKDFKLLIIGSGPETRKLRTIVSDLKIEDFVEILPEVKSIDKYYQACDLYVLLGRGKRYGLEDGVGLSLYEAAYYGKPVVASDSGGLNEALIHGKTGLLVPPLQPKETVAALEKLIGSKKLMTGMGERGKERIQKSYTWKDVASKILNDIN
jgi:phosphatidylinositol alpha-1,6-mannosyltransferase